MRNRDVIFSAQGSKKASSLFAIPNLLVGLNFAMLAGMTNLFLEVPFFGTYKLYLGQFFVLLCLITRGLNPAIVAALVSGVTVAYATDNAFMSIIYLLEVMVVHAFMNRGFFLFNAVVIYWAKIAIPLALLMAFLTQEMSLSELFIEAVYLFMNTLIAVSAASIFFWLLPIQFFFKRYQRKPPKLHFTLFIISLLIITLPASLIAVFFISNASQSNERTVQQTMLNNAIKVETLIDATMEKHLDSLQTVASFTSGNVQSSAIDKLLSSVLEKNTAFSHIALYDSNGQYYAGKSRNLDDASIAMPLDKNGLSFVGLLSEPQFSGAILSDVFDESPSITITSIISDNNIFKGVIQGALELGQLANFHKHYLETDYAYLIVDANDRILASSLTHNAKPMSNFSYVPKREKFVRDLLVVDTFNQEFLLYEHDIERGWRVIILARPEQVTEQLLTSFYMLVIAATIIILFFALISRQLAFSVSKPIENMIDSKYNQPVSIREISEDSRVSYEIQKITEKIASSDAIMEDFDKQLKDKVEDETRQLMQLSKRLYSIAQKDSLTQLYNRASFDRLAVTSYRNCIRNHIPVSVILIDIDHFKNINDSYGHPYGDQCIIRVAEILKEYCKRDTDIIGRYGGEEYIVLMNGGSVSEHHNRINMIADAIRQSEFLNNQQQHKITISAGICSVIDDFSLEYETLIKYADEQLYLSKNTGRDKTSILIK